MARTREEIINVLSFIDIPFGWNILTRNDGPEFYLQIHNPAGKDNFSDEEYPWKGRKWKLSVHMKNDEIVRTAKKALDAAIEHEVAEMFKYRGQAIFHPHLDVDKLANFVADPANISYRD